MKKIYLYTCMFLFHCDSYSTDYTAKRLTTLANELCDAAAVSATAKMERVFNIIKQHHAILSKTRLVSISDIKTSKGKSLQQYAQETNNQTLLYLLNTGFIKAAQDTITAKSSTDIDPYKPADIFSYTERGSDKDLKNIHAMLKEHPSWITMRRKQEDVVQTACQLARKADNKKFVAVLEQYEQQYHDEQQHRAANNADVFIDSVLADDGLPKLQDGLQQNPHLANARRAHSQLTLLHECVKTFKSTSRRLGILVQSKYLNINAQDAEGKTALHYAVAAEDIPMMNILLKANADSTIVDAKGKSAFDYVVASKDPIMLEYFESMQAA